MFTGIIEALGTVKSIEKGTESGKIEIGVPKILLKDRELELGESIAVEGACLTVTAFSDDSFTADISSETFSLTTLGELKQGVHVNLERALTLSTPVGGHLVTGHIDGVGSIVSKGLMGSHIEMEIKIPDSLKAGLVFKGSVAIDGISLTIASITHEGVRLALIPHTLAKTTLEKKAVGAAVNIETDLIGKYVENQVKGNIKDGRVTESFLAEHGFVKKG
ncbi:MAG: riboflavin synthase [Proteobacteria bacterium]|nr:riboflavin synthase [Pseudomonadota bacterium]